MKKDVARTTQHLGSLSAQKLNELQIELQVLQQGRGDETRMVRDTPGGEDSETPLIPTGFVRHEQGISDHRLGKIYHSTVAGTADIFTRVSSDTDGSKSLCLITFY